MTPASLGLRCAAATLAIALLCETCVVAQEADNQNKPLPRNEAKGEQADAPSRYVVIVNVNIVGVPGVASLYADEDKQLPAGTRRFRFVETTVDRELFGTDGSFKQVRPQLARSMAQKIEAIDVACELNAEQRASLRVAGEFEIRRFEDRIDALRPLLKETFTGTESGEEFRDWARKVLQRLADEAAPVRAAYKAGLEGEGSAFTRALERTLSPEQNSRRARAEAARQVLRAGDVKDKAQFGAADVDVLIRLLGDRDRQITARIGPVLAGIGRPALRPLLESLASDDDMRRANAALVLGGMRHPNVVAPLARLLHDDQPAVRESAAKALQSLGDTRRSAMLWIPDFGPDEPQFAGKPAAAINAVLRAAVADELVAAMRSENTVARVVAAQCAIHVQTPAMESALAACLDSDDVVLRKEALASIKIYRTWESLGYLLKGMADERAEIRDAAVEALRFQLLDEDLVHDERLLPALIAALDDKEDKIRVKLAPLLGKVRAKGYDQALPHLIRLTHSENTAVARAAIEGLAALGNLQAADRLLALIENRPLRTSAAVALAALGDARAAPALRSVLHPNSDAAIDALGNLRDRESVPQLIDLLKTLTARPNEFPRLNAIYALARIGDPRAVDPLIGLLNSKEATVAGAAAFALGMLQDPRAIEPLLDIGRKGVTVGMGGPPVTPVNDPIVHPLSEMGSAAVEPMARALGDPSERVRGAAARVLYHLVLQKGLDREDLQPAIEPLLKTLEDDSPVVRFQAALALGILEDARARAALLEALSERRTSGIDSTNAPLYLARLSDPATIDRLLELLQHPAPATRTSAVRVLGRTRDPRVVDALVPRLKDADPGVRAAAIKSLTLLEAPISLEQLLSLLRDEEPRVRVAAAEAAGASGHAGAADDLLRMSQDSELRTRVICAAALMRLGDARGREIIAAVLADKWTKTRREAAWTIATSATSSELLVPSLEPALADASLNVRNYAADALGRIKARSATDALLNYVSDHENLSRIVEALSRSGDPRALAAITACLADSAVPVRVAAAIGLGQVGDIRAVPALVARLEDESPQVRTAVIFALTRLNSAEAIPPLATAARDEHPGVRLAVERALRRLKP